MKLYKYTAIFTPEPGEDDVFNVRIPSFPEIVTFGESKEEARFMVQDALELVILSRLEHGEKIPANKVPKKIAKGAFTEEILVTVAHEVKTTPLTQDVKTALA